MIRVLFAIPELGGGGSERVLSTLLAHLDRERFEPHLAVNSTRGAFMDHVPGDVPVHSPEASRTLTAFPFFMRTARRLKPDIVFSCFSHLNLMFAAARELLPRGCILMARESNVVSLNNRHSPHPALFDFLYRRLANRFHRVVCQSRDMLLDLRDTYGMDESRGMVVHNPVDTEAVTRKAEQGGNPYSHFGPNILAAGRLHPQKGFDLLLRAFALLERPQTRLTILGEGPERHDLERLAGELGIRGRVDMPGFKPDPYAHMAHADLFVLSSRFEGFPNVVLEAEALGAPVAAFACPGGLDEIVTPETGRLAPPQDPTALARAMGGCLDEPFDRAAIAASVRKRFDVRAVIERYQDVFLGRT